MKVMKVKKSEFLNWVATNYGDAHRQRCAELLKSRPGNVNPDAILNQAVSDLEPEVKYDGRRFAHVKTSSP